MNSKNIHRILFVLVFIILIDFTYLTYLHYAPEKKRFCDINEGFSCDLVNKSVYSEILNIPVSVIGFFGFLAIGYFIYQAYKSRNRGFNLKISCILMMFSMLFSLYLVYAELYLIHAFCMFCLLADILIVFISLAFSFLLGNKMLRNLLRAISAIMLIAVAYALYVAFTL